jgi:hypothetical protein
LAASPHTAFLPLQGAQAPPTQTALQHWLPVWQLPPTSVQAQVPPLQTPLQHGMAVQLRPPSAHVAAGPPSPAPASAARPPLPPQPAAAITPRRTTPRSRFIAIVISLPPRALAHGSAATNEGQRIPGGAAAQSP